MMRPIRVQIHTNAKTIDEIKKKQIECTAFLVMVFILEQLSVSISIESTINGRRIEEKEKKM